MKKILTTLPLLIAFSNPQAFANSENSSKGGASIDPAKTIIANYEGGQVTAKDANEEMIKISVQNEKLKGLTFSQLNADQKETVIKEVVLKSMAASEAKRRDLDDEKDYKDAVKIFEAELLKQKLFMTLAKEAASEENVKKNYDELVGKLRNKKDVRISYIIVKTQAEAESLYKLLMKYPNSFAALARKKSLDKETGKKGGDLGFVMEDLLPSEILSQARSVNKGQIASPVATSGDRWVVIKFVDEKAVEISSYEKSKDALAQNLAKKAIENFVSQSLEKAKITMSIR